MSDQMIIKCPYCHSTDVIDDPATREYLCMRCGKYFSDRDIEEEREP